MVLKRAYVVFIITISFFLPIILIMLQTNYGYLQEELVQILTFLTKGILQKT